VNVLPHVALDGQNANAEGGGTHPPRVCGAVTTSRQVRSATTRPPLAGLFRQCRAEERQRCKKPARAP